MDSNTDVRFDASGSIVSITPLTETGREWMADNLDTEDWQYTGVSIAVDHRCAANILQGMRESGLTVSTAFFY